MQQLRSISRN